jgi:hypothetical protein
MKNSTRLLAVVSTLVVVSLTAAIVGCKYDVADPLWELPYTMPATPTITQVQPASAPAGVNTILISGQNLGGVPTTNGVYFGVTPVEVIEQSATSISVRRPNLVADSCTVNVVSGSALVVAKTNFGKIDRVMDRFGSFADGIALAAVTADSAGNLIIVSGVAPITIWRVSPGGDKSIIATSGSTLRAPFDATIRNGEIYLTGNNREIQKVNLTTGASTRWTQLPSGRVVKCGDFDAEGYYYTGGGTGADLCIVAPNPPSTLTLAQIRLSGFYAAEELMAIRFSRGYLYVASRTSASAPARIWRHSVGTGGTLGNQEPVANLGAYAAFSSRTVRALSFAASGEIYLTTDATDPLLICNPANATLDYYYKGIVPPYGKHAYWGSGVYLYMVSGDPDNTDTALRWNIARVNMGGPSATGQ